MTFIFIVIGIVNLAWLYIYTALRFPNTLSVQWLSISFEPARYIGIALTIVFALQLCLIAYLYFTFLWQRRVYRANAHLKAQAKIFVEKQKQYIQSTKTFESMLQNTTDTKGQVAILEHHIQELVDHHSSLEAQVQQVISGSNPLTDATQKTAAETPMSSVQSYIQNVLNFFKKAPKSFFSKK